MSIELHETLAYLRAEAGKYDASINKDEITKLIAHLDESAALLTQAVEIVAEERDMIFRSNEVDGVVTDQDAADEIAKLDQWLARAKAVLEQRVAA